MCHLYPLGGPGLHLVQFVLVLLRVEAVADLLSELLEAVASVNKGLYSREMDF